MRIIAFIAHSADIRQILERIGVDTQFPQIASARGPPLWEDCDAQVGEELQIELFPITFANSTDQIRYRQH